MARKPAADWEAIELRYRAGTESLRTLAAEFGITEGAIRQRAKKENWPRDLTARVEQATKAKLLRAESTQEFKPRSSRQSEREVIEQTADTRVSVILRHRKDIRSAMDLTADMLSELVAEAKRKKRTALGKRAPLVKQLTEALRIQIGLERQAFGIAGEESDQPEHVTNAAAAAAAGAAIGARTFSMAERAVRLARLLKVQGENPEPGAPT